MPGFSLPGSAGTPGRGGRWDYLRTAAGAEAVRLGDREVGVEHLLLGVFAVDDASVAALAEVGADLATLRRAVRERRRGESAGTGAGSTGAGSVEPTADRVVPVDFLAARALPFGVAAKALVDRGASGWSSRDVLLALLGDDGCVRLLQRAAVDVDHLRASDGSAAAAARLAPGRSGGSGGGEPAGSSRVSAEHTQLVPVAADRIRASVSDPTRRPEWDHRSAADAEVWQPVVHAEHDRAITWTRSGGPGARAASTMLLRVEPGGRAAVLRLRTSVPARAGLGFLLRPLLRATMRGQLRFDAIGVAQAASEDPGPR